MYSYLKCIVYDKLLKPRQSFRIILFLPIMPPFGSTLFVLYRNASLNNLKKHMVSHTCFVFRRSFTLSVLTELSSDFFQSLTKYSDKSPTLNLVTAVYFHVFLNQLFINHPLNRHYIMLNTDNLAK